VHFHLKQSNDLEIYEMENVSKEKLEEVCDVRQPVLFSFPCDKIIETTSKQFVETNYPAFEVKIRNIREVDDLTEYYTPLTLSAANKLFKEDTTSSYFTEKNQDFLQETGVIKNYQYNDEYLRPAMVSNCFYDLISGSANVQTPFRYEINYRNYFLVTQGSVTIKLAPPKSSKYLYPRYDYDNFEFSSPVNPWDPQPKYVADFNKIKCLEFVLTKGKIVFIPAYWWYSIQFNENTSISAFQYRTYMNNVAISPHIFMYALQNQNIVRNVTKKADVESKKEEEVVKEKEKE